MFPTGVGMNRQNRWADWEGHHVPHVCGDEPKVWKRYGKNDYDNPQDDEQDGQQEPGQKFERDELDPHNETVEHLSA